MPPIEQNIANNILHLRKTNNLTQGELAKKLNYSDKTISKWERGESLPDISMLANIAKIFNVNVDYLISEHTDKEIEKAKNKRQIFIRNLLIIILECVAVLLISTIVFVLSYFRDPNNAKTMWISFVAASPVCSLLLFIYAHKNKYSLMELFCISFLLWTLLTTVFCAFLVTQPGSIVWMIYLIGAPIQAVIFLFYFWRKTF